MRQVERLDQAFLVAQAHQLVPGIGALRLALVDHGIAVQVEVQEARHREVGDRLDPGRMAPVPDRGQDAAPDAHHDFHAGAAGADEQGRPQVDLQFGRAGVDARWIREFCHGVRTPFFNDDR